jgi:hypothetical protein
MSADESKAGWGSIRITYKIMTDSDGVQWKVPTTIGGEPCEYLQKHDPNEAFGTFERFSVDDSVKES